MLPPLQHVAVDELLTHVIVVCPVLPVGTNKKEPADAPGSVSAAMVMTHEPTGAASGEGEGEASGEASGPPPPPLPLTIVTV
jgi:hypothetical protein